jgi:SCO1/SenC
MIAAPTCGMRQPICSIDRTAISTGSSPKSAPAGITRPVAARTATIPLSADAASTRGDVTLYKNPQCGCCEGYADYSCPDACPTALNNMGVALDRLGSEAAALRPVFITVDPRRDTGEALAEYLKSFDPHIIALTGTDEQITAVTKEYHVDVSAHPESGDNYTVDHSSFYFCARDSG